MSSGTASVSGRNRWQRWLRAAFWVLVVIGFLGGCMVLARMTVTDFPLLIALIIASTCGVVVLTRPGYVIYLLALVIPLTSGTARGVLVPFFRANELILILLASVAVMVFLVRKKPFRLTWLDGLLLGFLAIRVGLPIVTSLVRGHPMGLGPLKVLFGPVQYYLLFRVVVECVDNETRVRRAVLLMLIASAVVAVVGVLQAIQVPGINEFLGAYYPADRDEFTFTFLASPRVTSLFAGDWNGCGLFMAMNVVLGLGTLHLFRQAWLQIVILFIVFLDLITVFLTASFTATLCLVIGLILLFSLSRRARIYLRPFLILLPILVVLLTTTFWNIVSSRLEMQFGASAGTLIPHTWNVRLYLWREVMWPYLADHWLWGLGTVKQKWTVFESYYVFLMLTVGIFGLLAYLLFSWKLLLRLKVHLAEEGWQGALGLVASIFVVQIIIANLSGGYFEFSGISETLWMLLGFLIAGEVRGGWNHIDAVAREG